MQVTTPIVTMALSLPSPRAFFAFLITERLSTTISEPATGYFDITKSLLWKGRHNTFTVNYRL